MKTVESTWHSGETDRVRITRWLSPQGVAALILLPALAAGGSGCISTNSEVFEILKMASDANQKDEELTIISVAPEDDPVRVAADGTQLFLVSPSRTKNVTFTYELNGVAIEGQTQPLISISGSALPDGTSTLKATATASDTLETASHTFNISKNSKPSIGNPSPSLSAALPLAAGGTQNFTASVSDADGDEITITWTLGSDGSESLTGTTSNGTTRGIFQPTEDMVGEKSVRLTVNDGFDETVYEWSVSIVPPVEITSWTPVESPVIIGSSGTQTFAVNAEGAAGATYLWELNGAAVTGEESAFLNLGNAALGGGNHTLKVTVSNAGGSDSHTFNLKKNTPPYIADKIPSTNTGNSMATGQGTTFSVDARDADNDTLTYTWKFNGVADNATDPMTGTGASRTITPTTANIGLNQISVAISDGRDEIVQSWTATVTSPVTITDARPTGDPVLVKNSGTTTFEITTAGGTGITYEWYINNVRISGESGSSYLLSNTSLSIGQSYQLKARAISGAMTPAEHVFNLQRNQLPVIGATSPSASGNLICRTCSLSLSASATDPDAGQNLTWSYKLDGQDVPAAFVGSGSNRSYRPTDSVADLSSPRDHLVLAEVSDGVDTATTAWSVTVFDQVTISSFFPQPNSGNEVVFASNSTKFFSVTPSISGAVSYSYTLAGGGNSTVLPGTSNIQQLSYTDLPGGAGSTSTLTAEATLGGSTGSKVFNLRKNAPPEILATTPVASGTVMPYTASIPITASAQDIDGHSLTYTWSVTNPLGAVANSAVLTGYNAADNRTVTYQPRAQDVGTNTITVTASDGFETTTHSWLLTIAAPLLVQSWSPTGNPVKIGASQTRVFSVNLANGATADTYSWKLCPIAQTNGVTANCSTPMQTETTQYFGLTGAELPTDGAEYLLTLDLSAAGGSDSHTFAIRKNRSIQITATGPVDTSGAVKQFDNQITYSSSTPLTFSANLQDPDLEDSVASCNWKLDSAASAFLVAGTFNSANTTSASANFSPSSSIQGYRNITLECTDNYETKTYTWQAQVIAPIAIASYLPTDALTIFGQNTVKTFSVTPNMNSGVTYQYKMNDGSYLPAIPMASNFVELDYGDLPVNGDNQLIIKAMGGGGEATRTFMLRKNIAPSVLSPSPAGAISIPYTATQEFWITPTDPNGDSVSVSWKLDGQSSAKLIPIAPSDNAIYGRQASERGARLTNMVITDASAHIVSADLFDQYDTGSHTWSVNVIAPTTIASVSPTQAVRIGSAFPSLFSITTVGSGDSSYAWLINGTTLADQESNFVSLRGTDFANLNPTPNILRVVVTPAQGDADLHDFTVYRNRPPEITSLSAALTGGAGTVVAYNGGTLDLEVVATDPDNDTLTYTWKIGGSTPPGMFTALNGSGSQTRFTPLASWKGSQTITVEVSDTRDVTTSSRAITIIDPVAIPTFSPSGITVLGAASSQTFSVTPNSGVGVSYSYVINPEGTPVQRAETTPYIEILGSDLATSGIHILRAIVSAGGTTAQRDFTIRKNQPPTISASSPDTIPSSLSVTIPKTITDDQSINRYLMGVGINDGDDSLGSMSYTWKLNGQTGGGLVASGSTAHLYPSTLVGTHSVNVTVSDGYDAASRTWTVVVTEPVLITSFLPGASVRIPVSGSQTLSVVVGGGASPTYAWYLGATAPATCNGTRSGTNLNSAMPSVSVSGSQIGATANVYAAVDSNGTCDFRNFSLTKNSLPVIASSTPGAAGTLVAQNGSVTFQAQVTDANSDNLTYTWYFDGDSSNVSLSAATPTGSNTVARTYTPQAGHSANGGGHVVRLDIFDGYDTVSHFWGFNVVPPVSITGTTPANVDGNGDPINYVFGASTVQTFSVTPSYTEGVTFSYKINGANQAATTPYIQISGANLAPGSNTLEAKVSAGGASATANFYLIKNEAPAITAWTSVLNEPNTSRPRPTGFSMAYTTTQEFHVKATDSHALTYTWKLNGAVPAAGVFTGTGHTVTFNPPDGVTGLQTVSVEVSDPYDTSTYSWSVEVLAPVTITSWVPTESPVVFGANTSFTFSATASSNSGISYSYELDGGAIGATTPFLVLNGSTLAAGPHTLIATISNNGSSDSHTFNLRKNTPPTPSGASPDINLTLGSTGPFTVNVADVDSDAVAASWSINGSTTLGAVFGAPTLIGGVASITFTPNTAAWAGNNRLRVTLSDGYETNHHEWVVNVINPAVAQISSSSPSGCELGATVQVPTTSGETTKTFSIGATGKDPVTYTWRLNGNVIGGNSSLLDLDLTQITPNGTNQGFALLNVVVADADSQDDCTFRVKRNVIPVLSGTANAPGLGSPVKVSYDTAGTGQLFEVSASDLNGDSLSSGAYTWYFDGNATSNKMTVGADGRSVYFNPGSEQNLTLTNPHSVSVKVNDGQEDSQLLSWTVHVNAFSDQCNSLAPGAICTLVGDPDLGSGLVVSDQTRARFKIMPARVIDDGNGNLFISDPATHVVWFYSKSGSGSQKWFGRTWVAGQIAVILGNGAQGSVASAISGTAFKLNTPVDMVWDSSGLNLYVADYWNHRIARVSRVTDASNSYLAERVIGGGPNNNVGNSTAWNLANQNRCINPIGLTIATNAQSGNVRSLFYNCNYELCPASGVTGCASLYPSIKQYALEGANEGMTRTFLTTSSQWVTGLDSDAQGNLYWSQYSNQGIVAYNGQASGNLVLGASTITPANRVTIISTQIISRNAALTNGGTSATATGLGSGLVVGMGVSGVGIGAGTTLTAVTANAVTLSLSATTTSTQRLNFSFLPSVAFGNGYPLELKVYSDVESGSTAVNGIFFSMLNNSSIMFWNANALGGDSYRFGGSLPVAPRFAARVAGVDSAGNNGNDAAANTKALSFNNSVTYGGFALSSLLSDSNAPSRLDLVIADTNNWRVRRVDLSDPRGGGVTNPGHLKAFIGSGNAKTGKSETTLARDTLMRSPSHIAFDPNGKDVYISDSGNALVRKINLTSGWVSVGPGRTIGGGNALEDQQERSMTTQQNPRGLAFVPWTTTKSVTLSSGSTTVSGSNLNLDLSVGMRVSGTGVPADTLISAIAANGSTLTLSRAAIGSGSPTLTFTSYHLVYTDRGGTNCHTRVVNFDTVSRFLLGSSSSIAANSVFTVLGQNGQTCANGVSPVNYTGGVGSLANAVVFRQNGLEGVAIDGALNLYAIDEDSHVVVKMIGDSSSPNYGRVYPFLGLVGVGNLNTIGTSGDSTSTRLSSPTVVAIDPRNPGGSGEDGNLFVADRGNSRILYVNRKASSINQDAPSGNGDLEAGAASSATVGSVTAITQWTPGQVRGIATFGNQICFSSLTYHNVQCYSRTDLNARSLLIGPGGTWAENSGGTFSIEGEGVPASSARMWNPTGLTFDSEGNLYIIDQSNHMVRKVARWPAVQD